MSDLRESIIAEILQGVEQMQPQPDDIFIDDLAKKGMSRSTAKRVLEKLVDDGRCIKVAVKRDGKPYNAYRPVEEKKEGE